ncbi:MAG: four helix bundle protein [Crocinitomicaceae bacterium]|nr:four helix bundle protein [Crocinitomicaceae bacterium]
MGKIKSYKDLLIWQKGIEITEKVYLITNNFPQNELFSLTNQIRRASVSISSNIAEGFGRNSTKSYMNFLKISRGSLYELETQLIIADRLNYMSGNELFKSINDLLSEEGKMINSYINKLELSNVSVN